MTVNELIGYLQECDGEAEVRIMMQEHWPFECAVRGVVTRDQLGNDDCDCDRKIGEPHDEECMGAGEDEYEDGLEGNDVFIVEGAQERYGARPPGSWCSPQHNARDPDGARETGRCPVFRCPERNATR